MLQSTRRLLILATLASLALAGCSKPGGAGQASTADMTMGDPAAKVKMVEYASATCPHCARFNNDVFPQFKKKYIDTGKVHYTFREFLTPPNQVAAAAFLMARCAGKDKYFPAVDAVFHNQQEMAQTQDYRGVLLRIAQSMGMTEQAFDACVSDEAALKALNDRVEKAVRDEKINATPTFELNGKKVKEGEITMAELDAAVAEASK
ncbi:DsbA family protein [Phenylobacterium sp.]|uniref:DsbA family protein n=1 Tax=Phenylobacterium sp. TaxID=1871053 RepID=UPI002F425374